jgi:hypothetical protein
MDGSLGRLRHDYEDIIKINFMLIGGDVNRPRNVSSGWHCGDGVDITARKLNEVVEAGNTLYHTVCS